MNSPVPTNDNVAIQKVETSAIATNAIITIINVSNNSIEQSNIKNHLAIFFFIIHVLITPQIYIKLFNLANILVYKFQ